MERIKPEHVKEVLHESQYQISRLQSNLRHMWPSSVHRTILRILINAEAKCRMIIRDGCKKDLKPMQNPWETTWRPRPTYRPWETTWRPRPTYRPWETTWRPRPTYRPWVTTWRPRPTYRPWETTWRPRPTYRPWETTWRPTWTNMDQHGVQKSTQQGGGERNKWLNPLHKLKGLCQHGQGVFMDVM